MRTPRYSTKEMKSSSGGLIKMTNTAQVLSLNVSEKKGTLKVPVDEVEAKKDMGFVGDAHAGPGIRQISLLAKEDFALLKNLPTGVCLKEGNFGENITTIGIELHTLPIGTRLLIGDEVELEVSKIGKECHLGCAIRSQVGDCIMPRRGIFAIVIKEGKIRSNDKILVAEKQ